MNEWYRTLIAAAVVGLGIVYVTNIEQDNNKSTQEISGETVTKTETNVSLPFFYQRRVCFYEREEISPETVTFKNYIGFGGDFFYRTRNSRLIPKFITFKKPKSTISI